MSHATSYARTRTRIRSTTPSQLARIRSIQKIYEATETALSFGERYGASPEALVAIEEATLETAEQLTAALDAGDVTTRARAVSLGLDWYAVNGRLCRA